MPFFVANFLEGPWLVLVLIITSSIINWLSKKRAEQEQARGESEGTPREASEWEERLRRLLGEEEQPAPPVVKPSPVQRPAAGTGAPVAPPGAAPPVIGPAQAPVRPLRPATPPMRPVQHAPVVEIAPEIVSVAEKVAVRAEESLHRFEQREPVLPATATNISPVRGRRSPALGVALRQPQNARQAFVASVVFGPPKALES